MKPGPAVRQRCSPLNLLNHLSGTVTACEPIQNHSITERIASAREDNLECVEGHEQQTKHFLGFHRRGCIKFERRPGFLGGDIRAMRETRRRRR